MRSGKRYSTHLVDRPLKWQNSLLIIALLTFDIDLGQGRVHQQCVINGTTSTRDVVEYNPGKAFGKAPEVATAFDGQLLDVGKLFDGCALSGAKFGGQLVHDGLR